MKSEIESGLLFYFPIYNNLPTATFDHKVYQVFRVVFIVCLKNRLTISVLTINFLPLVGLRSRWFVRHDGDWCRKYYSPADFGLYRVLFWACHAGQCRCLTFRDRITSNPYIFKVHLPFNIHKRYIIACKVLSSTSKPCNKRSKGKFCRATSLITCDNYTTPSQTPINHPKPQCRYYKLC